MAHYDDAMTPKFHGIALAVDGGRRNVSYGEVSTV